MDPDNKKCFLAFRKAKKCEELKEKGNEHLKHGRLDEAISSYTEALECDKYNK